MANGSWDNEPHRGGFMGNFGQPGVREVKQFSATTEEKIPLGQAIAVWFATLILLFFGYLCLKMLVTTRADWSLLIGIISIPSFPLLTIALERKVIKRYFPRVYVDFLNITSRALSDNRIGVIVLTILVLITIPLVVLGFYINTIVPQAVIILDQQAHIVFVFCAFIALIVAYRPYYTFNTRQLTDSLRDSDSKYATRALELENDSYWKRVEAEREIMSLSSATPDPESEYVHPILLAPPPRDGAPPTNAQTNFKTALFDFLDGLDSGEWDLAEATWRNVNGRPKILKNSRYKLMSMGGEIRDKLIKKGWGEYNHPDNPQRGWHLLFTTEEIRQGAFRNESTGLGLTGEGDGITPAENNPTDEQ